MKKIIKIAILTVVLLLTLNININAEGVRDLTLAKRDELCNNATNLWDYTYYLNIRTGIQIEYDELPKSIEITYKKIYDDDEEVVTITKEKTIKEFIDLLKNIKSQTQFNHPQKYLSNNVIWIRLNYPETYTLGATVDKPNEETLIKDYFMYLSIGIEPNSIYMYQLSKTFHALGIADSKTLEILNYLKDKNIYKEMLDFYNSVEEKNEEKEDAKNETKVETKVDSNRKEEQPKKTEEINDLEDDTAFNNVDNQEEKIEESNTIFTPINIILSVIILLLVITFIVILRKILKDKKNK